MLSCWNSYCIDWSLLWVCVCSIWNLPRWSWRVLLQSVSWKSCFWVSFSSVTFELKWSMIRVFQSWRQVMRFSRSMNMFSKTGMLNSYSWTLAMFCKLLSIYSNRTRFDVLFTFENSRIFSTDLRIVVKIRSTDLFCLLFIKC